MKLMLFPLCQRITLVSQIPCLRLTLAPHPDTLTKLLNTMMDLIAKVIHNHVIHHMITGLLCDFASAARSWGRLCFFTRRGGAGYYAILSNLHGTFVRQLFDENLLFCLQEILKQADILNCILTNTRCLTLSLCS